MVNDGSALSWFQINKPSLPRSETRPEETATVCIAIK
jgi:hypothetical protein